MTVGFELFGVEHSAVDLAIFAVGWTLGWLLLWRPRTLPTAPAGDRPAVAVVIPARDEAHALPHLLRPLVDQQRAGDRVVVVDDHSTDGTGRVARALGAEVVIPPPPPDGWLGKPNACWHGAQATNEQILVFLDADVRPGSTLLDDLAAVVAADPTTLVSMQPWHRMATVGEQPSILCNMTALMGCGAFTPFGDRTAANVAFGPVIAIDRATYDAVGGHAAPGVRAMHTEDIGLSRAVGRSRLFVGSPSTTTFRMYPDGFGALVRGWTRSLATGATIHPLVAGVGDDRLGVFDRRRVDRGAGRLSADRRPGLGARPPRRHRRPASRCALSAARGRVRRDLRPERIRRGVPS